MNPERAIALLIYVLIVVLLFYLIIRLAGPV